MTARRTLTKIVDLDDHAALSDPAAATAGLRTLGTGASQAAAGNDSRLSDSRTPTGNAGGVLAGTYPNPGGITGATAATRFVGGTTSGAPVSGTFAVGDFVIDQSGQVWLCVTAGTPGTWTCATKSRTQIARAAAGVLWEPDNPRCYPTGAFSAPASQSVYGVLAGLKAGDVVTGVVLRNAIAAAGTLPTTARFGLADSTGKMLALSGNLNALANWGTGPLQFPLSAPYTVLADGGYYACFVVNGTWGTTQPGPLSHNGIGGAKGALGSSANPGFNWLGQTDLPAIGNSLTIFGVDTYSYYIALY